jgi:hypothetical protein
MKFEPGHLVFLTVGLILCVDDNDREISRLKRAETAHSASLFKIKGRGFIINQKDQIWLVLKIEGDLVKVCLPTTGTHTWVDISNIRTLEEE